MKVNTADIKNQACRDASHTGRIMKTIYIWILDYRKAIYNYKLYLAII